VINRQKGDGMKTDGEIKRVLLISDSTLYGTTVLKGSSGARIFRKGREPVETLTGDKLGHLIFAYDLGGD
jgi:hypothetical protein